MARRLLLSAFVVIYFICSIYTMMAFMLGTVAVGYSGLDSGPYNSPPVRPVAYRVFVPIIAKAVIHVIPDSTEHNLTEKLIRWRESDKVKKSITHLFQMPPSLANAKIFETAVVAIVIYLTLLAFIGMLYLVARTLFPESLIYALLAPLIGLQIIPGLNVEYAYTYDFAELFFSCACFYLLFQRRWRLYIACLVVATLNKETTIFGILFYVAWFYARLPRTQFFTLLFWQLAAYAAVKGMVTWYFADLPGTMVGMQLLYGIAYVQSHAYEVMLSMAIIAFAVFYKWQEKPEFLRTALWIIPVNVGAFIVFCNPGEYRDLYFCMPVVILLGTHTLVRISGLQDVPLFIPKNSK